MRVIFLSCLLAVGAIIAAACTSNSQVILPPPGSVALQNVYWSFDKSTPGPELEVAAYPLTNSSVASVTVSSSVSNMLDEATSMLFDSSGRLWVVASGGVGNTALVFNLPLTSSSTPAFVLTLNGSFGVFGIAFDAQGNLWASSFDNNRVFEYTGPFNSTGAVSAALTLVVTEPGQPAFDANGNLYVPVFMAAGAIDVFDKPITNLMSPSATLNGVVNPFGLAFDASGNLYAGLGDGFGSGAGIARFNSNNLANGATPNTTDSMGQVGNPFSFQLAVDGAGNLYNADCGSAARLYVYPTVSSSFGTTLAPTVTYTDANIAAAKCLGGVAVR